MLEEGNLLCCAVIIFAPLFQIVCNVDGINADNVILFSFDKKRGLTYCVEGVIILLYLSRATYFIVIGGGSGGVCDVEFLKSSFFSAMSVPPSLLEF